MTNLRRLGLLSYAEAHGTLPPAYAADADGNPTVSWRVLILPYIEHETLYEKFKLDEPWDSPNNKPLSELAIAAYRSPDSKAKPAVANYVSVRGEDAVFTGKDGVRFSRIEDGLSKTIMVVEVDDDRAVPWAKPDDYEVDADDPVAGLGGLRSKGFVAGFGDGHAQVIDSSIDKETLKALFTRAGGEVIRADEF